MVKNIFSFSDFKGKKSVTPNKVNEMVDAIDDFYRVSVDVDLPKSLVASFIKKVRESNGKDLRADMGEKRLAERLVQWAMENYLNIENLPIEIVTGADKAPVQAQPVQAQSQVQAQPQGTEEGGEGQAQAQVQPAQGQAQAQPQGQVQAQPQGQAQKPAVQVQAQTQGAQKAQTAAAQVPAQEI